MPGRISDYQVEKWLRDMTSECYISLHYEDPDVSGAYVSEIIGGGYSRARGVFGAPSGRAVWNIEPVSFHGLPATIITHVGGWNAQSRGDLLFSIQLLQPIQVLQGGNAAWAAEKLAISVP